MQNQRSKSGSLQAQSNDSGRGMSRSASDKSSSGQRSQQGQQKGSSKRPIEKDETRNMYGKQS